MSKVEGKMSELEGSKTSFTAFTFYILYYLLIFKNIFSLDPRPGFRKPQGFFWFSVLLPFDHSRHLNPEYPAPLGVRHYVKFQERIKSKAVAC